MRNAVVTEIEKLAPSVHQVTIAFGKESFAFDPGQWLNFKFPEGVSRAYTIASAPQRPDLIELCVRIGEGPGGEALRRLRPGDAVTIDGPLGHFLLPVDDGREVVFIAGDVGIAPVRSHVLHMLAIGDERTITVLYEPDQRHILYAADFDPLARSGQIRHESGLIEGLIERNSRRIRVSILMAAGFAPFLERVERSVRRLGGDSEAMISESFGPQP